MKLETSEGTRSKMRAALESARLKGKDERRIATVFVISLLRDIDTLLAERVEHEASMAEIARLRAELDRAPPLPAEVEEIRGRISARLEEESRKAPHERAGTNFPGELLSAAASLLSRWPGVWRPMETSMKTFTMYRRNVPTDTHDENQRNAPDQPQFEGVVFSDGSVAIRWLTAKRSTAIWASMDDMLAIHGHPEYGSELVWTPLPEPPHE